MQTETKKFNNNKYTKLENKIRFITATSLFDGHDVSINIIRRMLQHLGTEVIHLGHNRSAEEVAHAAIAEDVQGIAISSYQGGHIEYLSYLLILLKKSKAEHIKIFAGGGGVISQEEIKILHKLGISKVFSPEDGLKLGIKGMATFILKECDFSTIPLNKTFPKQLSTTKHFPIAQTITILELNNKNFTNYIQNFRTYCNNISKKSALSPIIGVTGTGGSGKSSLIDEILLRFLSNFPEKTAAILSIDPSNKKTGGALLGDRIRLNSASNKRLFIRSMATRKSNSSISNSIKDATICLQAAGFDLILIETVGIGQNDSKITELCNISIYVMTPEYGAESQLEKIEMLNFADFIAINKFDKHGNLDAFRDVQKFYQRNNKLLNIKSNKMPIFQTIANRINDPGINKIFNAIFTKIKQIDTTFKWNFNKLKEKNIQIENTIPIIRTKYLNDICQTMKNYKTRVNMQSAIANKAFNYFNIISELNNNKKTNNIQEQLTKKYQTLYTSIDAEYRDSWLFFDKIKQTFKESISQYKVRDKTHTINNYTYSLSESKIPKIATPTLYSWGDKIKFLANENFPGYFPFTAGVFPFKRKNEDPTRMFAGEGIAEQTNKRFHLLSFGQQAIRLSTAFDSPTLYGENPDKRPDIYGKIGNAGVSICSLDDMKRLYSGFNLCDILTSVSMTINGPSPIILAYFFNTAIDSECERYLKQNMTWLSTKEKIKNWFKNKKIKQPTYRATEFPKNHDKTGLGFLGIPASCIIDNKLYLKIKQNVLKKIRGTVQADILKEDQAQNTCIFSSSFSLKMMGDVQQYFIEHQIRNFYSSSMSGYHIAEAGANPITQLAFTLANAFTIVEYYKSRGMDVNSFAHNLSFFFSNGLDAEYSVIGRVARKIWAIIMKNKYNATERNQKLKYHIQTSGRSLHAQEFEFNDIRTTLQALYAISDNCNSLHTNAYDEAITTPTEESVKRALAIQLIINKELGHIKNENSLQGSYFINYMSNIVENAVLKEFKNIDYRGGVLEAMETMYQRNKIQEESYHYENKKLNGTLPIIGVNTFLNTTKTDKNKKLTFIRSNEKEKNMQIKQIQYLNLLFHKERKHAINDLKKVAKKEKNIFSQLMETSKFCSLGEISHALYSIGGAYRRNM